MEVKAELVGEEFDGLNAKLFYRPGGSSTILFDGLSNEWAAITISANEETGRLNFYKVADVVKTHDSVTVAEALILVRAAQIEKRTKE